VKENSSYSNSCETAAVRVQYWFGKDKDNLLPMIHSSKIQEFSKKHKCDLLKAPRIPSQVDHLPLQGYFAKRKRVPKHRQVTKGTPSKNLSLAIDRSPCSISQKNFNHFHPENTLSSARVVYCRLKEHLLVSKKLKSISKNREASPKRHDVVPIKSSTKEDLSQNPYIQEWGKIREERHFHIGRVIKYLAD
jgi:hypothetical protein